MKWIYCVYLILCPLFFVPDTPLRSAQEYFFQFYSMAIIVSGLFFENRKLKRESYHIPLCALMVWLVLVRVITPTQTGWSILFNSFLGFLVYLTAIKTLKKKDIPFLFKIVGWVSVVTIAHLLCQYLGYDPRGQTIINDVNKGIPQCSVFGLKAAMGMYLAAVSPLVLSLSWVGVLLLVPLALSYSTGAVAGGAAGVLFFLWHIKRKAFWILLPALMIGGFFFITKMDNPMGMQGTRLPMWKSVVQEIHLVPKGRGFDSFRNPNEGDPRFYKKSFSNETVRLYQNGDRIEFKGKGAKDVLEYIQKTGKSGLDFWDSPHNLYLQLGYETGIPGLVGLGFIIYMMIMRFKLCLREKETIAITASLIAFAIFSLVQFPLHIARIGHLLPILGALFYISTEKEEIKNGH